MATLKKTWTAGLLASVEGNESTDLPLTQSDLCISAQRLLTDAGRAGAQHDTVKDAQIPMEGYAPVAGCHANCGDNMRTMLARGADLADTNDRWAGGIPVAGESALDRPRRSLAARYPDR